MSPWICSITTSMRFWTPRGTSPMLREAATASPASTIMTSHVYVTWSGIPGRWKIGGCSITSIIQRRGERPPLLPDTPQRVHAASMLHVRRTWSSRAPNLGRITQALHDQGAGQDGEAEDDGDGMGVAAGAESGEGGEEDEEADAGREDP